MSMSLLIDTFLSDAVGGKLNDPRSYRISNKNANISF